MLARTGMSLGCPSGLGYQESRIPKGHLSLGVYELAFHRARKAFSWLIDGLREGESRTEGEMLDFRSGHVLRTARLGGEQRSI